MDQIQNKYKATADNELYEFFIDYPPSYNEYGKQLIERDLDNALSCIFRSFYGSRSLLPEVPGIFVDIERYTHVLETIENRLEINATINSIINKICGELAPQISVEYDYNTQKLTYNISMRGEFLLKVEQGGTLDTATMIEMNKKFYD